MPRLRVGLIPALLEPESLDNHVVVVVDVLRATTTICMALAHGARQIIPTPSIDDAHRLRDERGSQTILGGERGGLIVEGFDQGNSPREYTRATVLDQTVVLCTTNGTVAMERCRHAKRVLIGSFVNLSATAAAIKPNENVVVVCAGTDRHVTSEDILFAGALIDQLQQPEDKLDDSARLAVDHWRSVQEQINHSSKSLFDFLAKSLGGRNLLDKGFEADVQFCAQIDLITQVPELDLENWNIQFAKKTLTQP